MATRSTPASSHRASDAAWNAPSSPCANTAAACWSSTHEKKPRTTTASSEECRDTVSVQTKEGTLPAVDAGSAPFALNSAEVRIRGLRPLGAGGSVDGEDGARYIGGHVACQEDEGVGDILGLAHATERDGGDDGLDDLFR